MSIGKKLKELRGDKTQIQICKDLGITTTSYSMYETDQRVPRDEIKKKIADYYKISVDKIFF